MAWHIAVRAKGTLRNGRTESAGTHPARVSHWEGLAIDGRVRYTKMVIRQSFLFLLKEQAIDKITVADVCRLAEINRATFYRHYDNQYSILYELELDLLNQAPPPQAEHSPGEAMAAAVQGLYEKQEEWKTLLASGADPSLFAKLYRFLEERLPWLEGGEGDQPVHRFLLHGLSGLLLDWMSGGFREPEEEMTALAVQYFQDLTETG